MGASSLLGRHRGAPRLAEGYPDPSRPPHPRERLFVIVVTLVLNLLALYLTFAAFGL